jgi:hypothetical protein
LTQDYNASRHPDAANAVPYELYDDAPVRARIARAEAVIAWLTSKMSGCRVCLRLSADAAQRPGATARIAFGSRVRGNP